MREIEISEEPIELYKILKFENMVASGGEAKYVIYEGQVLVNGPNGLNSFMGNK
jgi:ribosome-associated protein